MTTVRWRARPPRHQGEIVTLRRKGCLAGPVLTVLLWGSLIGFAQPAAPNQAPLNPEARAFVSMDRSIEHKVLNSNALGREEKYAVELPASYASNPTRRYPVLFFLHGQFGNESDWERNGISAIFEKLVGDHEIREMIVVMPNGGSSFFINSFDGKSRYEDFIVNELVPQIAADYRTIARREERGIMGVSMGGFGALTLAMKHPSVFSVVAAHSAAVLEDIPQASSGDRRMQYRLQLAERVFGNPIDKNFWAQNNPILLAEKLRNAPQLKIYFDCGDQDRFGFNIGAEALDRALTTYHIPHESHILPGNHGWEFARAEVPRSLKFISEAFQASEKLVASETRKPKSK